jgi:hypothetical protein
MDKSLFFSRLSLSQRERIEVRDCSGSSFQSKTKSPEERYRALRGSDGSRIEQPRFLAWPKIALASGRAFHGADNRGPIRPVRWQVSEPGNRNRGRTNRLDAAAGICDRRSFDFAGDAGGCARTLSHFCGDNGRDSFGYYLTDCSFL